MDKVFYIPKKQCLNGAYGCHSQHKSKDKGPCNYFKRLEDKNEEPWFQCTIKDGGYWHHMACVDFGGFLKYYK